LFGFRAAITTTQLYIAVQKEKALLVCIYFEILRNDQHFFIFTGLKKDERKKKKFEQGGQIGAEL